METALLLTRIALAIIFIAAGTAKLFDLEGSRRAVTGFGVPERFASPAALLLPITELAIGLGFILRSTAWWSSIAAIVLLLGFIAAISVNLAKGRTPDCHCFGQLHSAPVSWRTLARNAAMAIFAGFIAWQGPSNSGARVGGWTDAWTAVAERWLLLAVAVAVIAIAAEAWLLLNLLDQQGRILLRLDAAEVRLGTSNQRGHTNTRNGMRQTAGLPIGSPAPAFTLPNLDGEHSSLVELLSPGKQLVMVFSDTNCSGCMALLPDISSWQREQPDLAIALVSRGSRESNRAKMTGHGLDHVLIQIDREVAVSYQAPGTPAAVLVRPDGTIGSSLAFGVDAVRTLIGEVITEADRRRSGETMNGDVPGANGHSPQVPHLALGTQAPTVQLPDVNGDILDLASLRGRSVLLLFWDTGCGYCKRMLPDLKQWEGSEHTELAPQLVIVSNGSPDASSAMGLRAPILHARDRTTGHAFGAMGTPSAILLDGDGRIASALETGAPAIWRLLRGATPTRGESQPLQVPS